MNQKIRSAQELVAWFYDANLRTGKFRKQLLQEGVFVSAAIRREIMLDDKQGELIMNGRTHRIVFTNQGGGVYKATIREKYAPS